MKILLGTTNPSKTKRFSNLLKSYQAEFLTPKDLAITAEPEENGTTPEENAILKAKFYGQYFDAVICNDSGLYFEELALDDVRQPGLHVRTPMQQGRLSDEEMIEYYSTLVGALGGKVSAYYLDGIAVWYHGSISSFMDADAARKTGSFYMVEKASPKRFAGWPLDSLSLNKETGKYFVDGDVEESKENIIKDEYETDIVDFLTKSLRLE